MITGHVASGHDVCTSLVWLLGDVEEGADELLVHVAGGCKPGVGFLQSGRILMCLWLSVSGHGPVWQ